MKKFMFSLQKLLDYKTQLFDIERNALVEMQAVLARLQGELAGMQREHGRRTADFRARIEHGMSVCDMETHKNYMTMLDFGIRQKRGQITLQRKAIEKQMDKVREAKVEISTIDKLKERRLEEYRAAENKEQEQLIEEFVSTARVIGR